MKQHIAIICNANNREECSQKLDHALQQGSWVSLRSQEANYLEICTSNLPKGAGVILQGGGSTGRYQQCLHLSSHLDQSALATARWVTKQGLEPDKCYIFNPLPLHHVSGLLPWWRSRCWGAKHEWITNETMRNPDLLEKQTHSLLSKALRPVVTSLVPTQLHRLLQYPSGIRWLKLCTIIWIGGSSISTKLAATARNLQIRLAPCYGTTETAAMVTVQTPEAFLSGDNSLGPPLHDVALRLGENNALQIRTKRLARVFLQDGTIQAINNNEGWWESGDAAELTPDNQVQQLTILGRRDTAINSGGEIIFPEILQEKLLSHAQRTCLPVEALFLVAIDDEEWGERLVALVRLKKEALHLNPQATLVKLKDLVQDWSPCQKPIDWYYCPELAKNKLGKWEIKKWQSWARLKRTKTSI